MRRYLAIIAAATAALFVWLCLSGHGLLLRQERIEVKTHLGSEGLKCEYFTGTRQFEVIFDQSDDAHYIFKYKSVRPACPTWFKP